MSYLPPSPYHLYTFYMFRMVELDIAPVPILDSDFGMGDSEAELSVMDLIYS